MIWLLSMKNLIQSSLFGIETVPLIYFELSKIRILFELEVLVGRIMKSYLLITQNISRGQTDFFQRDWLLLLQNKMFKYV